MGALTDEDGAEDRAARNHENRDYKIHGEFDGSFKIDGSYGGLQGAEIAAMHQHFIELEFAADWAEARERLGDAATVADLRRTDRQRRADAAYSAWQAGFRAQAPAGSGPLIAANIAMDHETFERELRKLCGDDPGPDDRIDTLLEGAAADLDADDRDDLDLDGQPGDRQPPSQRPRFLCQTGDGDPLHPSEATAAALLGYVRRVVIGADGVVLDQGRLHRLFTGSLRDAVMRSSSRCTWIACLVPGSQCQADHLVGFNGPGEGRTDPGNGAPVCGGHNRINERGFTLYRDARGRMHLLRPDGTEVL